MISKGSPPISLLQQSKFKQIDWLLFPPKVGFLMISGEIKVNQFAKISLILEAKFEDDL